MEKLKTIVEKIDGKKLFIMNLPYVLLAYFLAKAIEMYNHMSGIFIIKLVKTIKYIRIIFIAHFQLSDGKSCYLRFMSQL